MKIKFNSRTGRLIGAAAIAAVLAAAFTAYQLRASAAPGTTATRITLDPAQFQGDTKQAYVVAEKHPELLAQLDCYCG